MSPGGINLEYFNQALFNKIFYLSIKSVFWDLFKFVHRNDVLKISTWWPDKNREWCHNFFYEQY